MPAVLKKKKNDLASSKSAPVAKPQNSVSKAADIDKAKIVAAITAAIIEFTGSSNFKILSVEAEHGRDYWTSRWKTAGMINLNSNRLNRKWN